MALGRRRDGYRQEESLEGMKMFHILVVVVVSQMYIIVKTHRIVHFTWIQFLYINIFSIKVSLRKRCQKSYDKNV